jgi:hypothetical protein
MNEEMLELAKLGIEAEAFMRSPLGKYLEGKALKEEKYAFAELVNAAPDDVKANTDLRNQIHVARMFLVWMDDAIQSGRAAHEQMRELEVMERE